MNTVLAYQASSVDLGTISTLGTMDTLDTMGPRIMAPIGHHRALTNSHWYQHGHHGHQDYVSI